MTEHQVRYPNPDGPDHFEWCTCPTTAGHDAGAQSGELGHP